jgi:hypothetical protein
MSYSARRSPLVDERRVVFWRHFSRFAQRLAVGTAITGWPEFGTHGAAARSDGAGVRGAREFGQRGRDRRRADGVKNGQCGGLYPQAVHVYIASAFALKGDTERAAEELAEARGLSGDDRFSSIARLKAIGFFGTPEYSGVRIRALFEATYFAGLRKAGMVNLDVDAPDKVVGVLTAAATAYQQSAVELAAAWQDRQIPMIWAAIASELDLAAWKIEKLGKQRFDRKPLLNTAERVAVAQSLQQQLRGLAASEHSAPMENPMGYTHYWRQTRDFTRRMGADP